MTEWQARGAVVRTAAGELALGLPSLRFAWFRDRLPYLYSYCAFLVTAHLFVLAHLNDMEPFFGVGSSLAVFSTAMLMTNQRLLVLYSAGDEFLSWKRRGVGRSSHPGE